MWLVDGRKKESYSAAIASVCISGYVTVFNSIMPEVGNLTVGSNVAVREDWINSYCATNPLEMVHLAAVELVLHLKHQ